MYLALFSLLLGTFSIGTTELVVAGVLPAIARDFAVSIAEAGFLVTGYALGVAAGGPALMVIASRYPRKPALLGVMLLFVLGHIVCAAAPSFAVLLAGRVVAAAAHGAFFGIAIVLATASVEQSRKGMALSILVGGINIASILGVPAGTAVGNAFGWRATFVLVGGFALIAVLAIAAFVTDARASQPPPRLGQQVGALRNRKVLTAYGIIVLHMIGFFSLITFIAPYMAETAGVSPARLPLVLLFFGVLGTVGIFLAGYLVDPFPRPSLALSYPACAVSIGVAWVVMAHAPLVGTAALAAIFLFGSIAAIAAQNRVLEGAFRAPELASTLMSSVFNIGIATGAALGSWTLAAGMAVGNIPLIGLTAFVAASALAAVAIAADRR